MSEQLSYTQVKNLNLSPLREAVTKWGQAPGKFTQIGTNFNTEVTKGLANSDWEGEAATAAEGKFRQVRGQIQAAAEESRRVHSVLNEALTKFGEAKAALDAIEKELEGHEYLRLNRADGSVYIEVPADEQKYTGSLNKAYQDTFADYRKRTRAALDKASNADSDLVQALSADVNGAKRGFNDKAYNSLKEAREESAEDLKSAIDLAKIDQGKLSSDQLARINDIMARHSRDPEFAERFATGLGPEKTLRLWYNATHPNNPLYPDTKIDEKAWWKTAKALQENLGTTLATASHSDSPEMKEWKSEILRMGPERVQTGANTNPYGYQLMSNLMRFGTYDKEFLTKYATDLTAWDKKNNTEGRPYWGNTADVGVLNLHHGKGEYDTGHDPVVGMLEGLGHNPEAATEFFRPGKVDGQVDTEDEYNENFEYYATKRDWFYTGDHGKPIHIGGHEALGHALTAATTGYAWDDPGYRGEDPEIYKNGGERRTAATADIMEQVVHLYGGEDGPKLLHEQPGMAAGLGQMGGVYIDDINRGVAGIGNEQSDAFPPAYKGNAVFSSPRAIDFLSVLGHDPVSHGLMNQAEHLYTLERLSELPPGESKDNAALGRRALLTEAEVRGTLDHARAQQIDAEFTAGSDKAQKAYQETGNWTRVGMTAAQPLILEGVKNALPNAGPWGLAASAVVGGTTEFMKLFHNDVIFGGPNAPDPVSYDQMFEQGEVQLGEVATKYYDGYDGGDRDFKGKLADDIKTSYRALGPQGNAFQGREPYTG